MRRSHTLEALPSRRKPVLRSFTNEKQSAGDTDSMHTGTAAFVGGKYKSQSHLQSTQSTVQVLNASHAASFVDAERMPFLAQHDLPTSHLVESTEVKVNSSKVIGEGDYTRTHEVKYFKWNKLRRGKFAQNPLVLDDQDDNHNHNAATASSTNPKNGSNTNSSSSNHDTKETPTRPYAIKGIHPKVVENTVDHSHELHNHFDVAARRLVLEALYLANLQHSFILPFRGLCLADRALFDQEDLESVMLITDRLGETLEMRMKTWKQLRLKREKHKEVSRQQEEFILGSLQLDLAMMGHDLMHHLPKLPRRDQDHHRHPPVDPNEAYPADLVALQTNYVLQVAHALEYLHHRGIVVRDLRPNTIGFKEYPHHHTVQLFQFGFCREIPASSDTIPPEPIQASYQHPASGGSNGNGNMSVSVLGGESMDMFDDGSTDLNQAAIASSSSPPLPPPTTTTNTNGSSFSFRSSIKMSSSSRKESEHFRRTGSREVVRSSRVDAKHYRAPETYPVVRSPRSPKKLHDESVQSQEASQHLMNGSDDGPGFHRSGTTGSTASNNTCSSRTSSVSFSLQNGNDGAGGPGFHRSGTNESAASNRSTASSNKSYALYSNDHQNDYKYQYNGYTTKADIYSLAMIYYEMMAEGKPFGRSILAREVHYYKVQSLGLRPPLGKHHFPRSVKVVLEQAWNPIVEKRLSATELSQTLTTILYMLEGKGLSSNLPYHKGKGAAADKTSTSTAEMDQQKQLAVTNLPRRAASLMISVPLHANNNKKGWSTVWNQKESLPELDSNEVMEAIQAHRVSNKDKKPKPKKSRPARAKSLTSWIPTFKMGGMMESDLYSKTWETLLGEGYKQKKKSTRP